MTPSPRRRTKQTLNGYRLRRSSFVELQITGIGQSDVGQVREKNEDRFLIDDEIGLYVVADGMGGHAAGEVAASIAVETIWRFVSQHRDSLERIGREGRTIELPLLAEAAITMANEAILHTAQQDDDKRGMGCTVTMLLVAGELAAMAHVGDSRLYRLRPDQPLRQLSVDHTVAWELVRSGLSTPDAAQRHQYATALSRSVGNAPELEIDTMTFRLVPGDRYLLASDGLIHAVPSEEVLARWARADDLDEIPQRLVDAANDSGADDNVTVVLVDVAAAPPLPGRLRPRPSRRRPCEPPPRRLSSPRRRPPPSIRQVQPSSR